MSKSSSKKFPHRSAAEQIHVIFSFVREHGDRATVARLLTSDVSRIIIQRQLALMLAKGFLAYRENRGRFRRKGKLGNKELVLQFTPAGLELADKIAVIVEMITPKQSTAKFNDPLEIESTWARQQ